MKRANYLIEPIADVDNLRYASWKAAKGKRAAKYVLQYCENLDVNIARLNKQILSGEVDVGNYRFFKIYDPKERQICASAFPEQVLHHAIMNVCHPYFEQRQIFNSYACRKGKGSHAAVKRARGYSRKLRWYLKLDVKHFFASVHHEVIERQLARMFKDKAILAIFHKIIDSYHSSPGRGLPIGNLSSQYLANNYLSALDHFIREKLRIPCYIRYMDDMVLWHDEKQVLKNAKMEIEEYVQEKLLCRLKPMILNRCKFSVSFLGYRVFPHHLHLTQNSKKRFIKKMNNLVSNYQQGKWDETTCQRRGLPLMAFVEFADTDAFLANMKW